MKKLIIFPVIFLLSVSLSGQNILDNYINQGLESNLMIKQKKADYEKSIYVLKEAKGYFMPSLSINARYSIAEGGRTFYIPIGDMLNPVYYTLNLISSRMYELGLAEQIFPNITVDNQTIEFLRPTEQETKAQLVQPIFNPQIYYNNKIKTELVNASQYNLETYQRQLVADIKTAYYNYLSTIEGLELIEKTRLLLDENIRVNEKLLENDKVTIDAVYRSRTELSKLEEIKAETEKNHQMAKSYFNFLLNRPLDTLIVVQDTGEINPVLVDLASGTQTALENRAEIDMLNSYSKATDLNVKMNKTNNWPTIFGVVDYGFQGEEYIFNDDYDFAMASFILKWDLFKGFQNKAKLQQAVIDKENLDYRKEELEKQISLQVLNAYYDLEAAFKKTLRAADQVKYTESTFKIIDKKYREGQANLLEFIDARTGMTSAKQNLILAKLNYKIKLTEYEKVTGAYTL
ncbi:MAG: hypothetical protein A2W91_13970 [Bacteroidetes bacterium GWF2_38_335]|nr:MAG: hypothetical protein A2W91_13970 [Bacteroidetes bacterium GWF2_38_335]OFY77821.1 MAG: hypothetical protein A2281_15660 [Bacteroidetes bacterium RIFOXYA12_FULL_38_20]HBS87371.1 hypothetical protein [Bacteroidales bacterium]